jgi:outer membrane protein
LRAIIGRAPKELKRIERTYQPDLPTPSALEPWIDKAIRENYQVRIAQANYDIASLEVNRQQAGHYPTVDLVASFNQTYAGAAASTNLAANFAFDTRQSLIGVQLNVPLYTGGLINSKVRQAIANLDASRQNLEGARRAAQLLAQV